MVPFSRGQGTTEYLIILAIVIVIALVVVGVLGVFPSFGTGVSEAASKAYWGGTQPLALIEWGIPVSGTGSLVFQNLTSGTITITDVNWSGSQIDVTDATISAGGKATVSSTSFTCGGSAGQTFSRNMAYKYNTPNLSGLWFTGATQIVGKCQ